MLGLNLHPRLFWFLPRQARKSLQTNYWNKFWKLQAEREEHSLGKIASSIQGSERAELIEEIALQYPFSSVLEIGTGFGQNLHVLAQQYSNVRFVGIDTDSQRIVAAKKFFELNNFKNVFFAEGDGADLSAYADMSVDLVIFSAVLLFVSPDNIEKIIKEAVRVCRKKIIFLEQHGEAFSALGDLMPRDNGVSDYYLRNYRLLLEQFVESSKIQVVKVKFPRWEIERWKEFASVICVSPR
jgi:SAM-dependent methyltransferase